MPEKRDPGPDEDPGPQEDQRTYEDPGAQADPGPQKGSEFFDDPGKTQELINQLKFLISTSCLIC